MVVPSPATSEVVEATSLHHLRAHVFPAIFEFNLFRHRHAVFRDCRAALFLLKHHVAPLRAEGDFHRVSELIDAFIARQLE